MRPTEYALQVGAVRVPGSQPIAAAGVSRKVDAKRMKR
jgi:hypothetical protein